MQSIARLLKIETSVFKNTRSFTRLTCCKFRTSPHWTHKTYATSHDDHAKLNSSPPLDDAVAKSAAFGQVMSAQANFVRVKIDRLEDSDAPPPKSRLLCVVRALLKKMKREVLVGDRIRIVGIDWIDGRGMVDDVLPRDSQLAEPPVANVSHVLLVFSVSKPPLQPSAATRYLVTAEAAGLPITIALNKADLLDNDEVKEWHDRITSWGYHAINVSVMDERGLVELEKVLEGKTTVVAGPSGAGKSSIINALKLRSASVDQELTPVAMSFPLSLHENETCSGGDDDDCDGGGTEGNSPSAPMHTTAIKNNTINKVPIEKEETFKPLAVGEISERAGRGKHTTRNVTLVEMPLGGLLVDTPGFNQPNVTVRSHTLDQFFPEIQDALQKHGGCSFSDCRHLGEPGCVVGSEWERYSIYHDLHAELVLLDSEMAKRASAKRERQGTSRMKSRAGGKVGIEAKLESKSHRRISRRSVRQKLSELTRDVDDDSVEIP